MQQEETVSQSKAALQVKCGSCTQVINGNGLDTTEQHLAQANAHTCSSIVTCDASYEHYHKHFHASLTYPPQCQLRFCHSLLRGSSSGVHTVTLFRTSICHQKWQIRSSLVSNRISTSVQFQGSLSSKMTGTRISTAWGQHIMTRLLFISWSMVRLGTIMHR